MWAWMIFSIVFLAVSIFSFMNDNSQVGAWSLTMALAFFNRADIEHIKKHLNIKD